MGTISGRKNEGAKDTEIFKGLVGMGPLLLKRKEHLGHNAMGITPNANSKYNEIGGDWGSRAGGRGFWGGESSDERKYRASDSSGFCCL